MLDRKEIEKREKAEKEFRKEVYYSFLLIISFICTVFTSFIVLFCIPQSLGINIYTISYLINSIILFIVIFVFYFIIFYIRELISTLIYKVNKLENKKD